MLIWGSKRKLKRLGTAADFCPICRRVQPFEVSRINMVKHVYYIPMGGGKVVGHLASCQECSVQKFVAPEHYSSYAEQDQISLEGLIHKTNPGLKDELAERLPLEKKIWNRMQLSPDERRFLISEPFNVISPMLELRYRESIPLDKTTGRSCLLTIIIPLVVLFFASLFYKSIIGDYLKLVGYALGVMGVLTTLFIIFKTNSRYLDRSIYPLFGKALYPFNPSLDELTQAVKKYKELGMIVGRKVKPRRYLTPFNSRGINPDQDNRNSILETTMIRKLQHHRIIGCSLILVLSILAGCKPNLDVEPMPEPTRDPVLEETIIQELEGLNPEAVDLYMEATSLLDEGDYHNARGLYGQLIDLVPEFSTAYRRLSYIESYSGSYQVAIELARIAVDLDPNGYNQSALAFVLLDDGSPQATREAFNLAKAAVEQLPEDEQALMALVLSSWLGYEEQALRESNQRLLDISPANPLAHYVAGVLAVSDGRWFKAERELLISQKLGMGEDVIQELMDSGLAWNLMLIRSMLWGALAIGIWLFGLGILYLIGKHLSKITLQALANETGSYQTQISPGERSLRSRYRDIIRILSIYFYISIPFVVLLVFVVVGAAYYIFSLIGFFPIYVVGIMGLVLVVSLIAVLRSVFRRVKDTPPGIELTRDQVPLLWDLNDNISSMLKIRSVDMIYLTPDAGIAVNESGNLIKRLRGAGVRNLILGMGVLPGLTQGQFAAVLAHEYGHFSNQDTAGGSLAYRVYGSLDLMARQLISGGAAFRFNPVWLFVVFYQRIYLKVTLGAKRLQEVLADRYAAFSMGSELLVAGLTNVVQESIRFNLKANYEIKRSLEKKIGIKNLYQVQMNDDLLVEFDTKYTEELTEETSDFDSHPALQERIDRISSYKAANKPIRNEDLSVLDLFPRVEDLQVEMTQKITDRIPGL